MAHDGNRFVVLIARQRNHARAEARECLMEIGIIVWGRFLVGAQHPMSALEHILSCALNAAFLGARHRMTGNILLGIAQKLLCLSAHDLLRRTGIGYHTPEITGSDDTEVFVCHGNGSCDHYQFTIAEHRAQIFTGDMAFVDPATLLSRLNCILGNVNAHKTRIGICVAIHGRKG